MKYELKLGDNAETLKQYPDNYFDSIVTDPPYGIEFLGKDWDKNTGVMETWNECYRVLKEGGHLLAFGSPRTYHNLATNIESAGFDIRDQLMWLYGSGFPQAIDIGKAIDKRGIENDWHGWKTALKPAHEPIVMARKPFKGSCIDNVLKHGTGALNIDESRIPSTDKAKFPVGVYRTDTTVGSIRAETRSADEHTECRYPSNVIGEVPEYQKFFYCPKVSRAERHIGFDKKPEPVKFNSPAEIKNHPLWDASIGTNAHRMSEKIRYVQRQKNLDHIETFSRDKKDGSSGVQILRKRDDKFKDKKNLDHIHNERDELKKGTTQSVGNNHPTVKPVELMKYLVKLVTPKKGKVLDPFNGSGSTGMACVELGYEYTGCELSEEYIEIATKRIEGWYEHTKPDTNFDELFDK